MTSRVTVGALMATLMFSTAVARAQDQQSISIELNDATDVDNACRLVFVAINKTGTVLDATSYQVVGFDASGKVGQTLTFKFGRLPVGKTKVSKFDLGNQSCASLSRLLVNDATECVVDAKPSPICLDMLTTSTRTKIEFGL